jgi:hypothetical protein
MITVPRIGGQRMASGIHPTKTPVGSARRGRPSLMAKYASLPDVRNAIDTLESQGIDGAHVTIVGAGDLPQSTNRRRVDSRFLSHTMLYLAIGVVGGALLGGLVGAALMGLVVLLWPGLQASGWVFLLLTVWFAVGGSVLGCFFVISRMVGFSESWPLTFEDEPEGPIWLAVFEDVDDPELLASRTHALEIVPDPDPVQPADHVWTRGSEGHAAPP